MAPTQERKCPLSGRSQKASLSDSGRPHPKYLKRDTGFTLLGFSLINAEHCNGAQKPSSCYQVEPLVHVVVIVVGRGCRGRPKSQQAVLVAAGIYRKSRQVTGRASHSIFKSFHVNRGSNDNWSGG